MYLINIFNAILESNTYKSNNVMPIKFNYKLDNPYLKFERLLFMNKISGFISMPNISNLLKYRSLLPIKNKIKIDLDDFDLFITSEPLNLISNKTLLFQTIHDLIPLEFNPNILNSKSFYNKLNCCEKSKRIFVSEVTKNKFEHLVNNKLFEGNTEINNFIENVLIQPPSLSFDKFKSINNYKNILNSISLDNNLILIKKSNKRNKKVKFKLKPFNYFLFNASVDKRKNVLLLIESFINSEAQKRGFHLVITGQLKDDEYSNKIRDLLSKNHGIISTGYINEAQKSAFFINALCLLSPSIIEGFGIPVLDACCIGLNCFASDCSSHREIQKIYDFKDYIKLYPPRALTKWSEIFYNEELLENKYDDDTLNIRLTRYEKFNKMIKDKFQSKLINLITK